MVDDFLKQKGYIFDSLPYNYTSEPPADICLVRKNLELIQQVMQADCKEMVDLLVVLTKDVYTVLDELISDTQFTIQHQSDAKNQSMGMVSSRLSFQQQQESLEKDMLYLLKMKAMDEEILKSTSEGGLKVSKGLEMTLIHSDDVTDGRECKTDSTKSDSRDTEFVDAPPVNESNSGDSVTWTTFPATNLGAAAG